MKIFKLQSLLKNGILLAVLFFASHINAQIQTEYQLFSLVKTEFQFFDVPSNKHDDVRFFKQGLGVGFGQTTGFGLSYRYFPGKLGVQGNLGLYSDPVYRFVNVGATFLYSIHASSFSNFYIYQANSYNHQRYTPYDEPLFGLIPNTTNIGLGLGLELVVFDNFALNIMYGYGVQGKFKTILPTPECALYYKFN
jgi:hypothetical protein